jgi:hypothetical protein
MGRTAGSIAGVSVGVLAHVNAKAITTCGGGFSAVGQHCMPQPAAHGQLASWLAGGCEFSVDAAAQILPLSEAPAATDNGSSNACNATT